MNFYFGYLLVLYPVVFTGLLLWLAFKTIKAYKGGNRTNAGRYIFVGFVASFYLTRTAIASALAAILFAFPASEADLIKALHRETGITLPPSARVTSYRTDGGSFGYWSGFLKAKVNCRDMASLKQLSGNLFDSQTRFDISSESKTTQLDFWRKSRFTIPAGSEVVEYSSNGQSKQTIYAINSKKCTVYYHYFNID
ncbi:MAG: hypothetical protein ACFB2W_12815 [Leptolyngbyaceae cyanobacterium]